MKLAVVLSCCCLAVALAGCYSCPPPEGSAAATAVTYNTRYAAILPEIGQMALETMRQNRIPGLSVALADSHGPVWVAGWGFADDARTVPVGPDTIFSVQSMSKTFTAVGVLTAVRDGLLDLDTPISHYLASFRVQSIFEERPQERITLRHLLTHTAGFTHEAPVGNNFDPADPSFDEHVASIQNTWLVSRVGECYQYSNLGIDVAGYLLQQVSGQTFPACMEQRVFAPLGLGRTTVEPARIRADANRAVGHQLGFRDLPVIVPMMAAGGVYTSARDLARFLSFMLREGREGNEILSPTEFREMGTTPDGGGYGLGVAIGRRKGDLFFTHGGAGYGFLSHMAWYPTLDIGVAVLTNSSQHDRADVALVDRIVDKLVATGTVTQRFSLARLPTCAIRLSTAEQDSWYFAWHPENAQWRSEWGRYLGTYQLAANASPLWYARLAFWVGVPKLFFVTVSRQGDQMALDGVPLLEQEPGLFFTRKGEALDFRADPPTWRNISIRKR